MNMVDRDFSAEKKELFNKMTGNVNELKNPADCNNRINTYPNAFIIQHHKVVIHL